LDKEWVEAGSRREASYSRLPPGRYQFQVMARGPEDAWRGGFAGLAVEILPRFWERRPVQLAAGLALLAGVAGAARTVERTRSRRRLERLELQRTLDAERHRIARDIHDDLGSGLTEIILLSDSLDEALQPTPADHKLAGEIAARARSLTRAMDEVVWAVNPRNDTLEGFLTYLDKFAQDYLSRAGLRCRWHVPPEVPELPLSAEVRHSLFLACKEALHNIIKHARASEVAVRLDLTEAGFTLAIEDDGQGFAAAQPPPRGNGLANMRQRLKELHGLCRVESTLGRGTRVSFSLSGITGNPRSP
jgi:signal transduction histidine kinase